jgi:hypothetical protein
MAVFIDSCVLLDVFTEDPTWFEWSAVERLPLLTCDDRHFRTNFPSLHLISPGRRCRKNRSCPRFLLPGHCLVSSKANVLGSALATSALHILFAAQGAVTVFVVDSEGFRRLDLRLLRRGFPEARVCWRAAAWLPAARRGCRAVRQAPRFFLDEVLRLQRIDFVVIELELDGVGASTGFFHSTMRWREVRMARPRRLLREGEHTA